LATVCRNNYYYLPGYLPDTAVPVEESLDPA